eukprot:CAMPEP_0174926890 /NCGR_PEP_ID=MMETSP1355-20121228/15930_1 /TAXON_ID=464990 /ORGANISM="Hemiselmis tepida, Strain CCMP443" /LENGTH=253 /DNA_ID=CAMNT_0016172955 /DNA_START=23 /DNA_END=780 /DNA_ORIENTATION=-
MTFSRFFLALCLVGLAFVPQDTSAFSAPMAAPIRGRRAGTEVRHSFAGACGSPTTQAGWGLRPLAMRATAKPSTETSTTHKMIDNAAKCAFLANTWKTQAEGVRALGWTQSSTDPDGEREMLKLQRTSYTADALAKLMPFLMAKAGAQKAVEADPSAADTLPPHVRDRQVVATVSAGEGSACGVWTEGEGKWVIDSLFANTGVDNQLMAQERVVKHIVGLAAERGVTDVRLLGSVYPCLYSDPEHFGFGEEEG